MSGMNWERARWARQRRRSYRPKPVVAKGFSARYGGTCSRCHRWFRPGAKVTFDLGRIVHWKCP